MMLTAELTVAMSKYPMWLGGLSRPPLKPTHEPMVTAGVLADMCRDSSMGIP